MAIRMLNKYAFHLHMKSVPYTFRNPDNAMIFSRESDASFLLQWLPRFEHIKLVLPLEVVFFPMATKHDFIKFSFRVSAKDSDSNSKILQFFPEFESDIFPVIHIRHQFPDDNIPFNRFVVRFEIDIQSESNFFFKFTTEAETCQIQFIHFPFSPPSESLRCVLFLPRLLPAWNERTLHLRFDFLFRPASE